MQQGTCLQDQISPEEWPEMGRGAVVQLTDKTQDTGDAAKATTVLETAGGNFQEEAGGSAWISGVEHILRECGQMMLGDTQGRYP